MYNYITDPNTYLQYSIHSNKGSRILSNYLKILSGGSQNGQDKISKDLIDKMKNKNISDKELMELLNSDFNIEKDHNINDHNINDLNIDIEKEINKKMKKIIIK